MTYQGYKKLSVELPQEEFDRVADNLHYGMLTATIRQLFKSLGDKIEEEGVAELYVWLDQKGALELAPPKKEDDL